MKTLFIFLWIVIAVFSIGWGVLPFILANTPEIRKTVIESSGYGIDYDKRIIGKQQP